MWHLASQPLRQLLEEERKELQRVSRASSEARIRHQRAVALLAVAEGKSLGEAAQEIQQESGSCVLTVPTDVTKEKDIEAIVAATVNTFGDIHISVNNVRRATFPSILYWLAEHIDPVYSVQAISLVVQKSMVLSG